MSQRQIRHRLEKILERVKRNENRMKQLSDEELAHLTVEFRERLQNGENLNALLPEAFAAMAEADFRVLGKKPYDVQIMGGIALHLGYLAEMNTGEGKTLVATLPLYLNALSGESTFLVTTNDYLAKRDAEEMGPAYRFMGLTIRCAAQDDAQEKWSNAQKKEIYKADIIYTTHASLGFDYLFNNLVTSKEEIFLRDFSFIIIDEADSVLLDAASTPLIISGYPRAQSNLYAMCDFFVTTLIEDVDYEREEKNVWLTEEGIKKAERYFAVENFYDAEYFEINRHVNLALRAHVIYEKEKDYVVSRDNELILLDSGSGRMMPGVKIRGGLHQALETKEGIAPTRETRSMASITYQNLFRLFPKMSGMSGTIRDASQELFSIYGKEVAIIPANRPVQRVDYPDRYYVDAASQYVDAIEDAVRRHRKHQPVLLVGSAIKDTEIMSRLLTEEKIPHNVLNANNAYWEAQIVKEAGQKDAVTVATSMAGRGTDIKLGEGVDQLGGLAVIGIGRLADVRLERQAKGRAGRQGDPGSSQFYVCLEDEIVKQYDEQAVLSYTEGGKKISLSKLKAIIHKAQKNNQEQNVSARRRATDYDQIMKRQRNLIYAMRRGLLTDGALREEHIIKLAKQSIHSFLTSGEKLSQQRIRRYLLDNIAYRLDQNLPILVKTKRELGMVEKYLLSKAKESFEQQKEILGTSVLMEEFMCRAALNAIDEAWVEQVDYLQQLQSAVSGRASAQRNPLFEYQNEARESFDEMEKTISRNIVRNVLLSSLNMNENGTFNMILP